MCGDVAPGGRGKMRKVYRPPYPCHLKSVQVAPDGWAEPLWVPEPVWLAHRSQFWDEAWVHVVELGERAFALDDIDEAIWLLAERELLIHGLRAVGAVPPEECSGEN